MEPSEDPATELQAAGRIHRLGQTKEVLIKRFAFRNTIEHAICDLHEEIKAKRVPAGAGKDNDVVKSVLKKHNLHHEVHAASGTQRTFNKEQRGKYIQLRRGNGYYEDSTFWLVTQDRCAHCKHWFEVSARKLGGRPDPDDRWWPGNQPGFIH